MSFSSFPTTLYVSLKKKTTKENYERIVNFSLRENFFLKYQIRLLAASDYTIQVVKVNQTHRTNSPLESNPSFKHNFRDISFCYIDTNFCGNLDTGSLVKNRPIINEPIECLSRVCRKLIFRYRRPRIRAGDKFRQLREKAGLKKKRRLEHRR